MLALRSQRAVGLICLTLLAGCATGPYRYGGDLHTACDAPLKPGEAQIERGKPRPVLDAAGWVLGIPSKIVMLDHRVNNHNVSPETEAAIEEYLDDNGLDRVKVRVNEYDPVGEWQRLARNQSVGWPIRYTFGTLSCVGYTLLPGRLIGSDGYNPYTNTINLYSDVPAVALYQGGHAKDYAQREYKGLYALADGLPGVGLLCHDARASNDVMGYLQDKGSPQQVKDGYRSVYPAYAWEAAQPFDSLTNWPVSLPAVVVGHVAGQVQAMRVPMPEPGTSLEMPHEQASVETAVRPVSAGAADRLVR